jgi:hypothetical protein
MSNPFPGSPADASAGLEVLSQVVLKSLEADPSEIAPFGASSIAWIVEGPPLGFVVEFDGRRFPRIAETLVTPSDTQTFTLSARAGPRVRVLGRVTVTVNTARCVTGSSLDIGPPIVNALQGAIDEDPELYFRPAPPAIGVAPQPGGPVVRFRQQRIEFTLLLRKKVDYFPDVGVDIKASFGLRVSNGRILATAAEIDVDVNVEPLAWLVAGALIALSNSLEDGRERARRGARRAIRGIASLLDFLADPGPNNRIHSVRLEVVSPTLADLVFLSCPDEPIRRLLLASLVSGSP